MTAIRVAGTDTASDPTKALERLRRMLSVVTRVTVAARTTDSVTFRGSGDVSVRPLSGSGLSIAERGDWARAGGPMLRFTNVYEWRFDHQPVIVRLSHTRFGDDRPVHLADLVPSGPDVWLSETPRVCGSDSYLARVRIAGTAVLLRWRVRGPHKCQIIRSAFRASP